MNRVKELRKESHLSLKELSNYVGISESTLNLIENDKRGFKQSHIEKLSNFFDVSSDYLLCKSERGVFIESDSNREEITRPQLKLYRQRNLIKYRVVPFGDSYCVLRELFDYSLEPIEDLRQQVFDYTKSLDREQLRKLIKFIEDYIK